MDIWKLPLQQKCTLVSGKHNSPQKNHVMRKEICKELLGDEFDDFYNDDYDERYIQYTLHDLLEL
jgi:hypothetical protein